MCTALTENYLLVIKKFQKGQGKMKGIGDQAPGLGVLSQRFLPEKIELQISDNGRESMIR